jgi:dihydrofolate reductase
MGTLDRTKQEGRVMRKLMMWNLMTLDGYFEGPRAWDLGFHEYAWGEELNQFSLEQGREVGALLFGRATYDGMAAHWTTATGETADFMNTVPKYVFSRTLESADWNNTTLVKGDIAETVERLKEQPGKDLLVLGSADLSAALIRLGLFDEYRIGLVPVTLGEGNSLFKRDSQPLNLELLQSRSLGDRCLLLRYRPAAVAAGAR